VSVRDRSDATCRDVERHDGDVLRCRFSFGRAGHLRRGVENIIERNDTIRERVAEAAHEANRENLGGDVHDDLGMIGLADAANRDQGARRERAERGDRVGLPPQQRQGRSNHPGAQHAQQSNHALGDVGCLQRDDRARRQAEP
jgi:hypothetical protein